MVLGKKKIPFESIITIDLTALNFNVFAILFMKFNLIVKKIQISIKLG